MAATAIVQCGEIQYVYHHRHGSRKTDTELAGEVEVSPKTFSQLKKADYRHSVNYLTKIMEIHRKTVSSPFPEYLDDLFYEYEIARSTPGTALQKFIAKHLTLLTRFSNALSTSSAVEESNVSIERARLLWLVGYLEADQSSKWGNHDETLAVEARGHMEGAVKLLEAHEANLGVLGSYYIARIKHSIVSSVFNMDEAEICSNGPVTERFVQRLTAQDYFNCVDTILTVTPADHLVLRNSILAAAVYGDLPFMKDKLARMIKVDRRYDDPIFTPTYNTPPFIEEKVMAPYIEALFTEFFT